MTRLDRFVVLVALSTLVVLGTTIATPVQRHALATPTPTAVPLPTARPPRLVREGIVGPLTALDPLYATTTAERDVSALLSCGLTRLGPGDTFVGDLASSWNVSDGGSTWTFRLRRDATWHDGRRVTADDVVFTVLSTQDDAYDGPLRGRWQRIVVERVDEVTVRFRLAAPHPGFLAVTSQPIVPEHVWGTVPVAERRARAAAARPVGCGPFRVGTPYEDGVELVRAVDDDTPPPSNDPLGPPAEPTPSPADPRQPLVRGFRFRSYPDEATIRRELDAGRLDAAIAGAGPIDAAAAPVGVREIRYATPRLHALVPNLRFDRPTFQDARVRRALLLALDRPALVRDALGGGAAIAEGLIPPGSAMFDATATGAIPYDPDGAARELQAAGWIAGPTGWLRPGYDTPEPLRLIAVDDPERPDVRRLAEGIVASWRAIGLQAELELVAADELVSQRLRPGGFEIALLELDLGLDPDLSPLLASRHAQAGGTNVAGYQSAETDAALRETRMFADDGTRRARFAALQTRLAAELPIVPLAFAEERYLVRDDLVGPAPRLIRERSDRWWNVLAWRFARDVADQGPWRDDAEVAE